MSDRTSFERLPETVGEVIHGEPFTLGGEDSALFQRATWLDRAYPQETGDYPETLVEGFWLLAMLDATCRFAGGVDDRSSYGLNYGLDKVRFVSPVHLGDRILPSFETVEVVPKGDGYKILRHCVFQVEGAAAPAMVADWWGFVLPRGPEKP